MPQLRLDLPGEPTELRAETRRLVEQHPEEGRLAIEDGRFIADWLWLQWREPLADCGAGYAHLLRTVRGYKSELRLWVVGERPWDHCIAGLAGRVIRRLPQASLEQQDLGDCVAVGCGYISGELVGA
ncbi:MAG: hypothetical protein M3281_09960 [Chloroflexota bacterium]|nr:hypothetical protein [Chloroflexota bacterium]